MSTEKVARDDNAIEQHDPHQRSSGSPSDKGATNATEEDHVRLDALGREHKMAKRNGWQAEQ
jgi:hypothetical protein